MVSDKSATGSRPSLATLTQLVPRLPRWARAALLTVHVAASVGWLGLDGALVALEATGLRSGDPRMRSDIADAMAAIAGWVLIPIVFIALVSGLVLALGTPWGLVRHWWLIAKSGIAVVLAGTGLALLLPRLHQVLAHGSEPVGVQTLVARSVGLVLLLAATNLSVVKPWGRTRLASRSRHKEPYLDRSILPNVSRATR